MLSLKIIHENKCLVHLILMLFDLCEFLDIKKIITVLLRDINPNMWVMIHVNRLLWIVAILLAHLLNQKPLKKFSLFLSLKHGTFFNWMLKNIQIMFVFWVNQCMASSKPIDLDSNNLQIMFHILASSETSLTTISSSSESILI